MDVQQAAKVVVDNSDVDMTTSSSGWRSTKQKDRLRIEIVGGETYAPPTLHLEDGTARRRRTTVTTVTIGLTSNMTIVIQPITLIRCSTPVIASKW